MTSLPLYITATTAEYISQLGRVGEFEIPYVAKFSRPKKFRESLPKGGDRNIRDKNIRKSGSGTLHNTVTWLLCEACRIFDGG